MSETEPSRGYWVGPDVPWRTPEARALRRLRRNFTRNYFRQGIFEGTDLRSLVRSATRWLLPWTQQAYPGRERGVRQLLECGEASAEKAVRGRASRRAMEKLASEVEKRVKAGAEIAGALRAALASRPADKPNGLCIIGEDGLRKHQARRGRAKRRVTEIPV